MSAKIERERWQVEAPERRTACGRLKRALLAVSRSCLDRAWKVWRTVVSVKAGGGLRTSNRPTLSLLLLLRASG